MQTKNDGAMTDATDEAKRPFLPCFVSVGYGSMSGRYLVFNGQRHSGDDGFRTKKAAWTAAKKSCVINSIRVYEIGGDPSPVDSCSTQWISIVAEACKEMDQDNLVETIVDHAPLYAMDRLRKELCLGDPKLVAIDWDEIIDDVTRILNENTPLDDLPEDPVGMSLVAATIGCVRSAIESQTKGSSDDIKG